MNEGPLFILAGNGAYLNRGCEAIVRGTVKALRAQYRDPRFLSISFYNFREEFEEHIFDRKCRANVCRGLRTFIINVEKCTGCTVCAGKCPVNAIYGTRLQPYFIVEDKCIGCGICYDVCKFSAVIVR